ncbi:four helix bundle protein [Candidatus Saganbacteria bacterium]|nr:four helix bundle protein [Candidatus Saganbacteria bacterium]
MNAYDLRERSYKFAVELVRFLNGLTLSKISLPILNQLLRSGTSVGANIEEADSSPTRKDFKYKISVSKKEAAETVYWLKLIIDAEILKNSENIKKAKELLAECDQLLRILGSIIRKA